MTVVDASAFVEMLLDPGTHAGLERLVAKGEAIAPASFDAEVLAALVKRQKRSLITAKRVAQGLDDLVAVPIERVALRGLIHLAWQRTAALSGYDALYVALATQLDVGLVTADRRLANALQLGVPVTVIPRRSAG